MPHSGDTGAPARERPLRRDAARNRERVLQAAREVFAERGLDATLDDIARHAGMGVGTVYRRFPNKQVLVDTLFEDRLDRMTAIATQGLDHPDPWEGFAGTLLRFAEELATDRGLWEVTTSEIHDRNRLTRTRERFVPAVDALVHRAQEAGVLRSDLRATDLPLLQYMIGAVSLHVSPVHKDAWRRYLAIILDGLRTRPDLTPLEPSAPSLDQLDRLAPPSRPGTNRMHGPRRKTSP